ncbi:MAG: hypothetical protein JSR59_21490 [Proteobacteria bacterium]|nr:hypothetical protein [Pseudomonadota bacterium]
MRRLPLNLHSYEHGGIKPPPKFLTAPARMLLPLVRFPLGYEIANPLRVVRPGLAAIVFPVLVWFFLAATAGVEPSNEGREYTLLYAGVVFLVSCLRFAVRAIGQHRGEEIHTQEAGYSLVSRLVPLPVSLSEQLVMPALLVWLGSAIARAVSADLGLWFMVTAASYFLLANWERRNLLAQRRAPVDDKIRAAGYVDSIELHEERRGGKRTSSGWFGKGRSTADSEIAEVGGKRRRRG